MDEKFWNNEHTTPGLSGVSQPSTLVVAMNECLQPNQTILELGSGNLIDAMYLQQKGHTVTAVDIADPALDQDDTGVTFIQHNLTTPIEFEQPFDVVYSRLLLHSLSPDEATQTMYWIKSIMKPGAKCFVMSRSVEDSLNNTGSKLGENYYERPDGHKRHFLNPEWFRSVAETVGLLLLETYLVSGKLYGHESSVIIAVLANLDSNERSDSSISLGRTLGLKGGRGQLPIL